jgi:uncharacterized low-complexity protein
MTPRLIACALAAALLGGTLTTITPAAAADNPFTVKSQGRACQQLAAAEGKCGGAKGSGGGTPTDDKTSGSGQQSGTDQSGGQGKDKMQGKCGEGKCGGST